MCSGCKRSHPNIPTCKNHTTEPLSSKLQEIKSKYQCEAKTIKTKIKKYTSAAKFIEGKIDESEMAQIEALTESNDIRIRCIDDINKYFDTIDDRIMAFIQDQISPLKQNRKSLLSKLRKLKIKWNELEQMIKEDARKLVVDGQAILDEAKQIDDFYSGLNIQYDDISIKVISGSKWKPTGAALLKMSGGARIPLGGARSKSQSQPKLSVIANKQFTNTEKVDLPNIPSVVRFIDNKLWVGMDSRVDIFDFNLNPMNQWSNTEWGHVKDVAGLHDKSVVIACHRGLFHVNSNGKEIKTIDFGFYDCAAYHDGKLYVYNYRSNEITIHACDRAWKEQARIPSPARKGFKTLSINDMTITICSSNEHKLFVMNHAGHVLHTYSARGSHSDCKLHDPHLCQEDDEGVLLVADYGNDRLQILDEQRKWSIVNLEPKVNEPRGAVYVNGEIFVVSGSDKKLYSYKAT